MNWKVMIYETLEFALPATGGYLFHSNIVQASVCLGIGMILNLYNTEFIKRFGIESKEVRD